MSELILHHYPPSPVSEKVRAGLGIKKATWRSCEQNRLPDRPELFVLTGGYRRIPVLQIGADIYCDTMVILTELNDRIPEPTLFPNNGAGLPYALGRWTDVELFGSAVRAAFAPAVESLPEALVADRARLYLGPTGDFRKEAADMPHTLAQLRAQLGWIDTRLSTGRKFMLADEPGYPDLLIWHIIWFVRGRYGDADVFLSEFPMIEAWEARMRDIGHGTSTDISMADALAVAKATDPAMPESADPRDPQGLTPGMNVTVAPTTDSGDPEVAGKVHAVSRDRIVLKRETAEAGAVCVHFPRVGYRVTIV
ncbi:MAG: glutathione S-transferase family protein [Pseudomonadota bacterium]